MHILQNFRTKAAVSALVAALLLWVWTCPVRSPLPLTDDFTGGAETSSRLKSAAYVYDKPGLKFYDRDAPYLDQLNYSFALIRDGKASGSHWQSIDSYKAYIRRHPHILPVLAVGGWGADGFSQAAASEDGRKRLTDSILALMEQHGFLGVDIDWEYPGSSAAGIASSTRDRQNFTLLLQALRTGLDQLIAKDGKKRMLGIAVGASPSLVRNIDCTAIGSLVDQVNIMTYDMQTPGSTTHHTALYSHSSQYPLCASAVIEQYMEAGIPGEKIMLGCAFYGRMFETKTISEQPLFSAADSGNRTMTYTKLQSFLQTAQLFFDEKAKAPYAADGTRFVTYDDPVSIWHKGAYASQEGLMGLMCWEYGSDSSGELLKAMKESLFYASAAFKGVKSTPS